MLGGFLRNPPVLTHSGAGQLTVTNYNDTKTYGVFTADGTPQAGTSVAGPVVELGDVYGTYLVSYTQNPTKGTQFSRLEVTYTNVNEPIWVPCKPPGPILGCCVKCDGSDWSCCNGGTPCSDGTICCFSCSGGTYEDNWVPKKDPVPEGYTEAHGEWVKIDNPEGDGDVSIEAFGRFYSTATFDDNYYVSFTGLEPGDGLLISLIFYDGVDPYAFYSFPTDTDNFEFHKPLGEPVELQVKHLEGLRSGTRYELVAYSDEMDLENSEVFREEGDVL